MVKYKRNLPFIVIIGILIIFLLVIILNGKKWYRDFSSWYIRSYCSYYCFNDFCFSPDGGTIATVPDSSTMKPVLWDWKNDNKSTLPSPGIKENSWHYSLTYSPDGKYFAVGCNVNRKIFLYDISRKMIISSHSGLFPCFSSDGKKFIFYEKDDSNNILIWDIESNSLYERVAAGTITSIGQYLTPLGSDSGKSLIAFNFTRNFAHIDICDIKNWDSFLIRLRKRKNPGTKLVWNSLDKKSKALIEERNQDKPLSMNSRDTIINSLNRVLEMPDLYQTIIEKGIKLDKTNKRPIERYPEKLYPSEILNLNRNILCLIFPDEIGSFVPNGIGLWDINKSECAGIIPMESGEYRLFASGNMILVTDKSNQNKVIRFHLPDGKKELIQVKENIVFPAFSSNGRMMAFLYQDIWNVKTYIKIWDLDKREEIMKIDVSSSIDSGRIRKLRFSPDGRYIASGSIYSGSFSGQIEIYEISTGRKVKSIKPPDNKIRKILIRGLMILREK